MAKNKFPVLATLLLILGLVWFVQEVGYAQIDLPWVPVIVIVIAVGMIFNRFKE